MSFPDDDPSSQDDDATAPASSRQANSHANCGSTVHHNGYELPLCCPNPPPYTGHPSSSTCGTSCGEVEYQRPTCCGTHSNANDRHDVSHHRDASSNQCGQNHQFTPACYTEAPVYIIKSHATNISSELHNDTPLHRNLSLQSQQNSTTEYLILQPSFLTNDDVTAANAGGYLESNSCQSSQEHYDNHASDKHESCHFSMTLQCPAMNEYERSACCSGTNNHYDSSRYEIFV